MNGKTKHLLRNAARLLAMHAKELARAHTIDGVWPSKPDAYDKKSKADHDEMIETAKQLRKLAQAT